MPLDKIRERTAERKLNGAAKGATAKPKLTASVPLPVLYECANGGTDDDIVERCHTCGGSGRHVRECEVHKTCTHTPVNPGIMDCLKCQKEGLGFVQKISLTSAPK